MSITMAMKLKSPRSNIIVTMRTVREGHATPRRFRDAADSHRDHLRSETHVAGGRVRARAGIPCLSALSVRQKAVQ